MRQVTIILALLLAFHLPSSLTASESRFLQSTGYGGGSAQSGYGSTPQKTETTTYEETTSNGYGSTPSYEETTSTGYGSTPSYEETTSTSYGSTPSYEETTSSGYGKTPSYEETTSSGYGSTPSHEETTTTYEETTSNGYYGGSSSGSYGSSAPLYADNYEESYTVQNGGSYGNYGQMETTESSSSYGYGGASYGSEESYQYESESGSGYEITSSSSSSVQVTSGPYPTSLLTGLVVDIHFLAGDTRYQYIAYHYCSDLYPGYSQCNIYNGTAANSKLVATEIVVSAEIFATLPMEERTLWHSHAFAVKSGLFVSPNTPADQDLDVMASVINSYGKITDFWHSYESFPVSGAKLAYGLAAESQVNVTIAEELDRQLGLNTTYQERAQQRASLNVSIIEGADDYLTSGKFPQYVTQYYNVAG